MTEFYFPSLKPPPNAFISSLCAPNNCAEAACIWKQCQRNSPCISTASDAIL